MQPVDSGFACAGADGGGADGEDADGKAREDAAEPEAEADPLAAAVAERDRLRDQLLRTAADFDNFRKRTRKEAEEARARGRDDMLKELLPVLDNFERAIEHADAGGDAQAVLAGLTMVQKLVTDTLERAGVRMVDEVGVAFDPSIHDALSQEATDEVPPGTVVRIVQKGYRVGDRLVRPATVVVAVAASRGSSAPPRE
jgi:molecular chaperone GrpE